MSRKISRELAMKLFYQIEMTKDYTIERVEDFIEENSHENFDKDYILNVGSKFIENKDEVDEFITKYSKGWKLDRIAKVDLSIIRLAIVELIYREDIPFKVSINEAVELAKKYANEDSSSFINGVLGSVLNDTQK
ncbi:transcription antitermination factor NusB [Tepidibacter formicigenes]|jgi:N utilization substance protein B|uniref:Transcription antitermination protein NusB n=1 Tax=Tepidibacter formicigenes DSM 15518 TaxID=1123349 RepID=A0A1M6L344_9FIRM|nr:transcription antitermination factor NusB [Tepidibacter formicigenes]SHJ65489.1 NusB antitermination factor [Tepidibacter formicigenes DSM 15518]